MALKQLDGRMIDPTKPILASSLIVGGLTALSSEFINNTVYVTVTALSSVTDTTFISVTSLSSVVDTVYIDVSSFNVSNLTAVNIDATNQLLSAGVDLLDIFSGNNTGREDVNTIVTSNSANWDSAYATTTSLSSDLWNAVYTNVQSNSATYATISFTDSKYVPTSGGTFNGNISSTGNIFTSAGPVVVSSSTLETPTTGISAINNIVALSQATYNDLTIKLPTTLYVIV